MKIEFCLETLIEFSSIKEKEFIMCWAYRFAEPIISADATNIAIPHMGRIIRSGQEAAILAHRKGKLTWIKSRFGMSFPKSGGGRQLIWNARDDKLKTNETWTRLIRQRFAIPVNAYVENTPNEIWYVGNPAWLIGFYDTDQDGGAVVVTEDNGQGLRKPILIETDRVIPWLTAKQWAALPELERAPRAVFAEADLFVAKQLEADARTKVPLPNAA
jgi:putative SOS response-associated peptidase YedK